MFVAHNVRFDLGFISYDDTGSESISKEYNFDVDTYKILYSYLLSSKNIKNVRKLNSEELGVYLEAHD